MERAAWTDERLDGLSRDFREMRAEMRTEFGSVRAEIGALRMTLTRVGGGVIIALVGVIAAIFVNGA